MLMTIDTMCVMLTQVETSDDLDQSEAISIQVTWSLCTNEDDVDTSNMMRWDFRYPGPSVTGVPQPAQAGSLASLKVVARSPPRDGATC